MKRVLLVTLLIVILLGSIAGSVYLVTRPGPPAFTLSLFPSQLKGDSIAGQRVVLLVTVESDRPGQNVDPVKISASAPNSSVYVEPSSISPGQVGEITVIPDVKAVGTNVTAVISGERGGLIRTQTIDFRVLPGEDTTGGHAIQLRDIFVQWLQVNFSELGITNQTQWLGTVVSPHWLVVSHYLFLSKDWEIHVYWHVMIPPYDWARIDLRHRFTELAPSLSFEIPSLNSSLPVQQIPPPETTWR